jgi:ferric-dicitrate binding protein FerR (iron transport regulator)
LLPDGSQVYLNHHSSISYHEDFDPRKVNLDGEAFFTVVSNESIFTVVTAHGDIEVLGTEFNVKTTSDQVVIDVKKGLVELKTKYDKSKVKKGIKAVYKDSEQTVQKIKSNKEYRKWILSLERDFTELGKQLKPALKEIGNEFKKTGK